MLTWPIANSVPDASWLAEASMLGELAEVDQSHDPIIAAR
jgi:hypothetical protein